MGDHASLMQDRNAIGKRQNTIDIVFDHQDTVPTGELPDQRRDAFAIFVSQARQRLVQQQDLRIGGDGDGNLQQALLAMRQIHGNLACMFR